MSRSCSVANCSSRTPDWGPNKRSVFQFPTNPERREKWLTILSPHLKPGKSGKNLYVCELHFLSDDIIRGIHIVRLKNSSVPRIFNDQHVTKIEENNGIHTEELELKSQIEKSCKSEVQAISSADLPTEQTLFILPSEVANSELNSLKNEKLCKLEVQEILSTDLCTEQTLDISPSGVANFELDSLENQKLCKLEVQEISSPDLCTEQILDILPSGVANFELNSLKNQKLCKLEVQAISSANLSTEQTLDISPSGIAKFELNSLKKEVCDKSCQTRQENESFYDIDMLKSDIARLKLGEDGNSWICVNLSTGVYLMYLKDDYPNVTRSLMIKDDMTVEIRVKGVLVQHDFKTMGCIEDVLYTMIEIAKPRLCVGIDVAPQCTRGFATPKSRFCIECQIDHHKRKKNERERAKRKTNRDASSRKFLKNLKSKYKRLQKNYNILLDQRKQYVE